MTGDYLGQCRHQEGLARSRRTRQGQEKGRRTTDQPASQGGQDSGQGVALAGVVGEGEIGQVVVEYQIESLINVLLGRLCRDRRNLDRGR